MLLRELFEFAHGRGILDDLAFASRPVRWIVPLDTDGELLGQGLVETAGGGPRGREYSAPRTSRDKGVGGIAEFLADGLTAVFGVDTEPEKKLNPSQRKARDANNKTKHEHFWRQITAAQESTADAVLGAVATFRKRYPTGDWPFLRYGQGVEPRGRSEKKRWWVKTASGDEVALGITDQFSFQVNGALLLEHKPARTYWRSADSRERSETESEARRGICLVTGKTQVPIARTHLPLIKGVPGSKAQDRKLVSFDKDAFASYGFAQSHNAPVSLEAAAAYTNALTWMLQHEDHSLRLGPTAVCFWARESHNLGPLTSRLLSRADPKAVADFLKSPWGEIDRTLAKKDSFCSVTLAGNAGRVVVRRWAQQTVEQAVENLRHWFSDLQIIGTEERPIPRAQGTTGADRRVERREKAKTPPLAIFRLACSTVRDAKDLRPEVATTLYRAAIEGHGPPVMLLQPTLEVFRWALATDSDTEPRYPFNVSRFALLRLILNRNRKEGDPMIEPQFFETDDAAYNCGGLLAVLAEAQAKAHDFKLEGPGLAERYFGAASVSPSSVFPLILRLNRHHLDKIGKSERYRTHRGPIEDTLKAIIAKLQPSGAGAPPQFPRVLDLQAQGRFAIGFYQQKAEADAKRAAFLEDRKRAAGAAAAETIES